MNSVDKVIEKYEGLEDYLSAFIDDYTEQVKERIRCNHLFRYYGILLKRDNHKRFPSFNHWKFTRRYVRQKEEYPGINPSLFTMSFDSPMLSSFYS